MSLQKPLESPGAPRPPSPEIEVRPPEAPLEMPEQVLERLPPQGATRITTTSRPWRKACVGVAAVAMTAWATHEMYLVLDVVSMTPLEWAMLLIFAVNICWICFAFATATAGFIALLHRRLTSRNAAPDERPIVGKTAIAFPIYNEDAERVFANVEMTARALDAAAPGRFECFVLSDTTNPDVALAEEAAFLHLRARLAPLANVYYRRRVLNLARKSGNVQDFITRWGGRYDYMIVYDADSYMETSAILELVRRMEAAPETGLIQTVPQLIGGSTIFARTQQFAAALYGPILGTGVAWWAQDEGNFWGHNAIVRIKAFAEAAGLPKLPGKAPFGGPLLSHDFVEAALLRRAGWRVIIAADIKGSYEECPPTIIDVTIRDRRWCQGNLQHLAVLLRTRGLAWTSRLHLAIGVMSYLASPLWLLLILVGMGLSLQGKYLQPDYFGDAAVLFPNWPVIDAARALSLFGLTMGILFATKIYGLAAGLLSQEWRKAVGPWKIAASTLSEIIISALMAPILMAAQSSAVLNILLGRDTGWAPQKRSAGGYSKSDVYRRHAHTMALGLVLTGSALLLSPVFLAWLAPAIIGLVFAGSVSIWTSADDSGRWMRKLGLLATPAERLRPKSFLAAHATRAAYHGLPSPDFNNLLRDEKLQSRRAPLVDAHWPLGPADVHPPLALGIARAMRVGPEGDCGALLTPQEKIALLNAPDAMIWVSRHAAEEEATSRPRAVRPPASPRLIAALHAVKKADSQSA